jgi:hypothetical protein
MANTQAASWSKHLQECERLLAAPPTRGTWLRRAYARLYRFLIAQYGDAPASADAPSSMPFVASTESLEGRAARSPGQLRAALKQIRAAQPLPPAPLSKEAPAAETWITVAQKHERYDLAACARLLEHYDIPCRELQQNTHRLLQVPVYYRSEALALIAAGRDRLRIAPVVFRQHRARVRGELAGFAMTLGFSLGCIFAAFICAQHARLAGLTGLFISIGVVTGFVTLAMAMSWRERHVGRRHHRE